MRRLPRLAFRAVAAASLGAVPAAPVNANQWVIGDVDAIWEYTGYSSDNSLAGILVSLGNMSWGSGTTSNGSTACWARFKIVTGVAGVTDASKDRMWSALLTAQSIGKKIQFYVDPSTAPYCAVNLLTIGPPLQ